MIPRLPAPAPARAEVRRFLDELSASAFAGDIATDYATRVVMSTDNSVYQILPQAVVFPRTTADVETFVRLAAKPEHCSITFSPRGGGTGTNGQSLSDGIIVDLSRHMRRVLEIDVEAGFVRVEPGVVLDQLNADLRPHGVFFAPTLSPSNRATLGGMINTDACGKGSRIYGRTSNHVLELELVMLDGTRFVSKPVGVHELTTLRQRSDAVGRAYDVTARVVTDERTTIAEQFPKLKRFLTGYNLAHAWPDPDGPFDLNPIVCGSEGTLAFVTAAKLRLTPLPAHKTLVVVKYASFDDALAAARQLVELDPGAIETVDDTILTLARKDVIWSRVEPMLRDEPGRNSATINLVEFESHDADVVADKVARLLQTVSAQVGRPRAAIGAYVAKSAEEAAALWELRKKGVGLLGNAEGERRPIAFVEDTAVPPERLADYIRDFRALLEAAGLRYGMFGHVDVGCLHVRPALDMRDPEDEKLLRVLSDQVVDLVARYGGVMWSEHGKGFRSEYSPRFFGDRLYAALREVKAAFDPGNRLSPGKLATPAGSDAALVTIDAQKRGSFDRQIAAASQSRYRVALHCNGNGACFNYNPDAVMCPSSKVTRDRLHSPKGRAGLLREWLRQLSEAGLDAASDHARRRPLPLFGSVARWLRPTAPTRRTDDFSHQVYDAMQGCLACKACATECPIHVDVPHFRSEFLELYHTRYRHPLKDRFMATLEPSARLMAKLPRLFNALTRWAPVTAALRHVVGIVDTPALAVDNAHFGLAQRNIARLDPRAPSIPDADREHAVIIVQDAFTSFYHPSVLYALCDLVQALGGRPFVLRFFENGKGRHVKGFLSAFRRVASQGRDVLSRAAKLGVPLVGIDPAVVLTYRDEYPAALGAEAIDFRVLLPQEWLVEKLDALAAHSRPPSDITYALMGHCTERTAVTHSGKTWQRVFAACGLRVEDVAVGCCGMCGAYGHERVHQTESRGIYEQSWQRRLRDRDPATVMATGFSCRSQIERFDGHHVRHPVEVLRDCLVGVKAASDAPLDADASPRYIKQQSHAPL